MTIAERENKVNELMKHSSIKYTEKEKKFSTRCNKCKKYFTMSSKKLPLDNSRRKHDLKWFCSTLVEYGWDVKNGEMVCIYCGTSKTEKSMSYMDSIRERSEKVDSKSKLVSFLYVLIRDYVTPGNVESIMMQLKENGFPTEYSNGWLAKYAIDLEKRLK